jgi:hypothetical protein
MSAAAARRKTVKSAANYQVGESVRERLAWNLQRIETLDLLACQDADVRTIRRITEERICLLYRAIEREEALAAMKVWK